MLKTESGRISKTQAWNALVGTAAMLVGTVPEARQIVPPEWWPFVLVAIKGVDSYLRLITSEGMAR